ncbi:unnamed protein product [Cyprideis torosa]|uniref:Uncharacterized protein n=1 Tax=Cyprideis torosa TaxID=163714 RepID=A0A7R8ZJP6_9CRUS|nr:unnamed protein product [Cyprideis torosa]CAG0887594.1 unnamed protein product [Cyprideis torosa]
MTFTVMEHPGKCYLPGMNKALKPNELWKEVPNICAQVRCTVEEDMEGNAQYKAVFSGCPSYGVVLSPCHLGGRDQSLPYPDCCPALEDCGEFTKEQLMRLKEKQKALKLDLRSNFPKKKSQNPKDKLKKNKK